MERAKIKVSGVHAVPVCLKDIPRGIKGAPVRFEYADPLWDGLSKTVVFKGSGVTKDILDAGEVVKVPPEVVERAGQSLLVGVYGTDADGNQAIPTLWADLGRIRPAADPSGDGSQKCTRHDHRQLHGGRVHRHAQRQRGSQRQRQQKSPSIRMPQVHRLPVPPLFPAAKRVMYAMKSFPATGETLSGRESLERIVPVCSKTGKRLLYDSQI